MCLLPVVADEVVEVIGWVGLAMSATTPVKLGTLAREFIIFSRLTWLALASGSGVAGEVDFDVAAAELATAFAVPSKLGMLAAMLSAMLSTKGGAEGGGTAGALGAEPPMEVANPANEGMLLAMMSVIPARVGKTTPWSDPGGAGGGASSPLEGTNTAASSAKTD